MNWKNGRCRASMIYDNVHEKSPKNPCTRKCTRFFRANMVLCGTIKHHNKTSNQGFTALWHALGLCKLMGYASSLSATNIDYQWFASYVHENVHETPDFTPISGVFLFRFFLFLPQLKHWYSTDFPFNTYFSPRNNTFFATLCKKSGNRVQQKNEARRQNRASTLFPSDEPGLSQQCGAKVMNLIQNLA